MKNLLLQGLTLAIIVIFSACETTIGFDDEDLIPTDDIPSNALNIITQQYSDYQIRKVKLEDICDNQLIYEVELENGSGPDIDLYFNQDWSLLSTGVEISSMALPVDVKQKVASYAGYTLEEDKIEQLTYTDGTIRYKVKLAQSSGENDIELIINSDGTLFCSDDDDLNNDSNNTGNGISSSQMPGNVLTFIQENYAGYSIVEVEKEDLCDDNYYFEVELEDGPNQDIELYFSLQWEFLFEMIEIEESDLPSSVLDTINEEYPNHEIEKDDIYQLNWRDGTKQYLVELDGHSDPEIIFNEDGKIDCIDN